MNVKRSPASWLSVLLMVALVVVLAAGCDEPGGATTRNGIATTTSSPITASGGTSGGGTTTGGSIGGSGSTSGSTASTSQSGTATSTTIRITAQTTPYILPSIERLVAQSDDVVIATVEQVLPTVRIDLVAQGAVNGSRPLYQNISSFRFRVDEIAMGRMQPGEQFTLDLHGGFAEGVDEDLGTVFPKLGVPYLLFLYRPSARQDQALFRFLPVDTFSSYSEIRNGQLILDNRAKAFQSGAPAATVLAEVRRIVASMPISKANFSKKEVDEAKAVVRDYFAAIANRDPEALKRTLYGSQDPEKIFASTPKTTVLALNYNPEDPARTSALIPDLYRNDYANVIVLRADLRRTPIAAAGVTPGPAETVRNKAIVLSRIPSAGRSWEIRVIEP